MCGGKTALFTIVLLQYHPTPVQEITDHPSCKKAGIRLLVKREDLNHPAVSGNKWWKLKYNLESAAEENHRTILTFGGAFSNHIYATAAAARELNFRSIGIIRGEETMPLNPTLSFAQINGMQIHYADRSSYRQKSVPEFTEALHAKFGEFFLIPEGGSNLLAVKGCAEFAEQHLFEIDFDHLVLAVGTGGTMAGLVSAFQGGKKIVGISVLKNGDFLKEDIAALITRFAGTSYPNWSLLTGYHGGGYAKSTPELLCFIREMKNQYGIPLDHVYTGKMLFAVIREIEAGAFQRGSTVLALHSGGLQGNADSTINR